MSEDKPAGAASRPPAEDTGKQPPEDHQDDNELNKLGQEAAQKASRDNRTMSGLARAGLVVGVVLLAITVLIGMVPALSYSLILQDDLVRRLLLCISVGLILASLGDYAFVSEKTVNRVFTIGGAGAIALILFFVLGTQRVEQVWAARVRFDKDMVVKTVYLLTADSSEYEGKIDPQYTQAKIYRFRVPQSIAEQITQECFTIAIATEDSRREKFEIQGAEARLPQSVAYVFDFTYDGQKKSLVRQMRQGSIQDLPKCIAAAVQDAAPTQKQIQSTITVTASDKPSEPTRSGWTYYGKRDGKTWDQRVYDNKTRQKDAEPRKSDQAEVISDVFLRPDPRTCRSEDDCDKLTPDIGILKIGSGVKILDVSKVLENNFWVKVEVQ
jgi:hypothetical protein